MQKKSVQNQTDNPDKSFSVTDRPPAEMYDIAMVERFIEENSGEYKRKAIWSRFSQILTYKNFNQIINDLHESGKIAIDREGKIGWIWNPDTVKKYRGREDLAFK